MALLVLLFLECPTNVKNDPTDEVQDWNALSDAKESERQYGNNLHLIAKDWESKSIAHYQVFYRIDPERVKELASANSANVLEVASLHWMGEANRCPHHGLYCPGRQNA